LIHRELHFNLPIGIWISLPLTLYCFLTIVGICVLHFFGGVPHLRFQNSLRYGEIQIHITKCTWMTCWEIGALHISWIVIGILTTQRKTLLHQSTKFERNMNHDFFNDLELWRRRHQLRSNWKGLKGRERDRLWSPHQICRTRKMFQLNLNYRQNLAWVSHLFKKFQWIPVRPSQSRKRCRNFRPPRISISSTRTPEKTTQGNHLQCKGIKYWEVNSIVHSLANS
jgi:hypothetical protein